MSVINKTSNIKYVAKKILLGVLSEKEQKGALNEVELLKKLQHPNIVAYNECFNEKGVLIIIME